jgi:hypothetical protein
LSGCLSLDEFEYADGIRRVSLQYRSHRMIAFWAFLRRFIVTSGFLACYFAQVRLQNPEIAQVTRIGAFPRAFASQ